MDGTIPESITDVDAAEGYLYADDDAVYWTQPSKGTIFTCKHNERSARRIFDSSTFRPTGIAIIDDIMYFSDPAHEAIFYQKRLIVDARGSNKQFYKYKSYISDIVTIKAGRMPFSRD